jgi:hypothetical protein
VRLVVDHSLSASPEAVFAVVDDLGRYPSWTGLVHSAEPLGDDTWSVQLRARIGPLARSKKLTMARVVRDAPRHVRFERRENDGRSHGEWVLEVTVESEGPNRTRLVMSLSYGGRLWSSVVEKVLHDEIEASKRRLDALLAG